MATILANPANTRTPTPQEVFHLIQRQIDRVNSGIPGTPVSTFICHHIRVGSYYKNIIPTLNFGVTISRHGFLFEFPHARTGVRMHCPVPIEQVTSVQIHSKQANNIGLIVLTTTERYAVFLRGILGMNESSSLPNYFCPESGDITQKHLVFLADKITKLDASVVKNYYVPTGMQYEEAISFLKSVAFEENVQSPEQLRNYDQMG